MLRAAVVVCLVGGAAPAVGEPIDRGRFTGEPFASEPFAFEVFTRQQGAPENSFYALAPDRHGRLALGMINGAFMNEEAGKLANRLKSEAGEDVRKQVALGLRLVTCRTPTGAEVDRGVALINGLEKQDGATHEVAMKEFSLMVLNLNEFAYVE